MFGFISLRTFDLIAVLYYYLILAFLISMVVRIRNYRAILGVIFTFSNRWPKLLVLAKLHRIVFLRWPTLLPVGLSLSIMMANTIVYRFVWRQARVTFDDLWCRWPALLAVTISGGLMVFLDCKAIFCFGQFDRAALEENLDKAEHWLQSWQAPVLRFVTLGLINPRKIVNDQILEALVEASLLVNGQVWRWLLQIAMRVVFCFALWITWVLS